MAESTTKSTRERARKLQIPGRSKMSKAQLDAAIARVEDAELSAQEMVEQLPEKTGMSALSLAILAGAFVGVWLMGLVAMALGPLLWTLLAVVAGVGMVFLLVVMNRRNRLPRSKEQGGRGRTLRRAA